MKEKINILFLDYIKDEIGGGHFVLARMAEYFQKHPEHGVTPFVMLNNHLGFCEKFLAGIPDANKREYTIPETILRMNRESRPLELVSCVLTIPIFLVKFSCILRKMVREHNIKIIHANGITAFILSALPSKIMGVTLVYHLHDALIGEEDGGNIGRTGRRIISFFMRYFTDRVIVVSRFVLDTVKKIDKRAVKKSVVVHNGLILKDFDNPLESRKSGFASRAWNIRKGKEELRLLSFGVLSERKGFDLGIQTAAILKSKYDLPLKYKILGDGYFKENLQQLAKKKGLQNAVEFLGFQDKVSRFGIWADFIIIPSRWQDPLPLAVIESMLSGCVVLSTNVGGIPEMIQDGETGILVPLEQAPERMAKHIAEFLKTPHLYEKMANKAKERVKNYFNIDRMTGELISVYQSVL